MARKAKINRKTKETNIIVEANLDGRGSYKINTKIGFLNQLKNVWIIVRAYDLENLSWYLLYRIPSHLYLLLQQY